MKYLKSFAPLLIVFLFLDCERDDICAEGTETTPRLLIEFYDVASPDDLKNVPRLTIYGESPDITIPDNTDSSGAILTEPFGSQRIYNINTNTAGLPLIIDNEGGLTTTRFVLEKDTNLRLDDDDTTNSNLDIIEINYLTEFVYVSRACGYKSIFNIVSITRVNDDENWISSIELADIEITTIENENRVHVRINH